MGANATPPRFTRNEALVFEALRAAGRPQKAYDILEALKPEGVRAPMTVYRALDGLVEKGRVHKLEGLNAFMLCESDHSHEHVSHVFVICGRCGEAREIEDCDVEARVRDLASAHGFTLDDARLEISGICAQCRTVETPGA